MLVKTVFLPWHLPVSMSNSTLRGDPEIHDLLSEHINYLIYHLNIIFHFHKHI